MSAIRLFAVTVVCLLQFSCNSSNQNTMQQNDVTDDATALSMLNAQFIKNYIRQDVAAHNEIIHTDFVCIENSGNIVGRNEYMRNWATDYQKSSVDTFYYTDEVIRIFGNTALVRSKSIYTYTVNGIQHSGASVYTDTYIKENGRWWCVQAHMTPVK